MAGPWVLDCGCVAQVNLCRRRCRQWEASSAMVPDASGQLPDIQPGTPLATFNPDTGQYYGSDEEWPPGVIPHAGIFLGYIAGEDGEIVGFSMLDQWQIGNGAPAGIREYMFGSDQHSREMPQTTRSLRLIEIKRKWQIQLRKQHIFLQLIRPLVSRRTLGVLVGVGGIGRWTFNTKIH